MNVHDIKALATEHGLPCHSEAQAIALGRFLRDAVESQIVVKLQSMAEEEMEWDTARWSGMLACINMVRNACALFGDKDE